MTGEDAAIVAILLRGLATTLELATAVLPLGMVGGTLYAAAACYSGPLGSLVARQLLFLARGIPC